MILYELVAWKGKPLTPALNRALGATVITIPSAWFLWPDTSSHGGHGHDEHHEEGGEEHEEASEEEPTPDDSPDDGVNDEAKTDPSAPVKDTTDTEEAAKETEETAKPSGSQGESQPQGPDANKESSKTEEGVAKPAPEGKSNVGKGPMNENAPEDTRKREPDAKGGYKKRVDSGYGKNLGEGPQFADDETEEGGKRESVSLTIAFALSM